MNNIDTIFPFFKYRYKDRWLLQVVVVDAFKSMLQRTIDRQVLKADQNMCAYKCFLKFLRKRLCNSSNVQGVLDFASQH